MRAKILSIAVVLVLLVAGLVKISDIVHDRQVHRVFAIESVAQSLAGSQTLLGPLIHLSCSEEWDIEVEKKRSTDRREFMLTAPPANLVVRGASELEPRYRGLHATQVFTLKAKLSAQWPDLAALKPSRHHAGSRLNCGAPILMLAVSDARGIRQASLQANGQDMALKPGTFFGSYPKGVHAALPASMVDPAVPLSVELQVELVGTERLSMVPLGGATEVRLSSNWPHPSFDGRFLPSEREITERGFNATWRVSSLASTAQQDVAQHKTACTSPQMMELPPGAVAPVCIDAFSVRFIDPTDTYALSDRATKYGLLFIGLTFVAIALFEFMKALRVHPIQYLLVGAAISMFFLLLVSLSEHIAFSAAYALAASSCVLLLAFYASYMLGHWRRGAPFGLGIAVLYGLLYVLLQLEQTALAVGAIALFLLLAVVMTLTRRVDWYARFKA